MATAAERPGCVIVVIDESASMQTPMPASSDVTPARKTKAESSATAVNSFLNGLIKGPEFDVAIVGYRSLADQADVGPRWGGPLAGRDYVRTTELVDAPLRIEERIRRRGGEKSTLQFPIWYEPVFGEKAPQVAAFTCAAELIENWWKDSGPNPSPPIVCHLTASSSADGNPQAAVKRILELDLPTGAPLVFNLFLSSYEQVSPNSYPSNRSFLPSGPARSLYDRSSLLPDDLIRELRQDGVAVNDRARALVYNARMLDIVRCLGLIRHRTESWSALTAAGTTTAMPDSESAVSETPETSAEADVSSAAAEELPDIPAPFPEIPTGSEGPTVSVDRPATVVFLVDTSLKDPYAAQMHSACDQLCSEANELLGQVVKEGRGAVDLAVYAYGAADDKTEIRSVFAGPLADRAFVRDNELADNPLRVEELVEKIDDGTGGLLEVRTKKQIYVELEPTEAGSAVEAFSAVAQSLADWTAEHPPGLGPIVLHLTRGEMSPDEIRQAASRLQAVGSASLYHIVKPEYGHPTVFFPAEDAAIENDNLKALFAATSPLLDAARIAAENPVIHGDSRGIVIKGKFTLLLDAIRHAMA